MSIWSRLRALLGASMNDTLDGLWRGLEARVFARESGEGEEGGEGLAFTIGLIALSAKLAKADGRVTLHEVEAFNRLFDVPVEERADIQRFFDIARRSMAGFDSYAGDLARVFRARPAMLEDILDGLFDVALADGEVHDREIDYLARAAEIFGFAEGEFERILASHLAPERVDPYRVLGLDQDCSDEELRRSYLRLVRENHPDSFIARGLPPELIAVATQKLAAINHAYDVVVARRRGAGAAR